MEPLVSGKKSQPCIGRKGRSTAGCLFPPSVSGLCFPVYTGFLHIVGDLAMRIPMLRIDSDCTSANSTFPGKGLPESILLDCLNPSAVARKCSLSEPFVWSGRKSINSKTRYQMEGLWSDHTIAFTKSTY